MGFTSPTFLSHISDYRKYKENQRMHKQVQQETIQPQPQTQPEPKHENISFLKTHNMSMYSSSYFTEFGTNNTSMLDRITMKIRTSLEH